MKRYAVLLVSALAFTLTGSAAASTSGTLSVYGIGNNSNGPTDIVLTGIIGAKGKTSNVSKHIGRVTTPQGTFEVNKTKLDSAKGHQTFNSATCSGIYTATGQITLFNGTGAYTGIAGTLTLRFTGAVVLPRLANGKCNQNANGQGLLFFSGSGHVIL
jgi:hypothetical protein